MSSRCAVLFAFAALACASATAPARTPAPEPARAEAPSAVPPPTAELPEPGSERAASGGPGWLGVELAQREGGQAGVLLKSILRGSPAEVSGLAEGDVVLTLDGTGVSTPSELRQRVVERGAGARVSVGVLRGEATRLFAVELGAVPDNDALMRQSYVGAPAPDFGALDAVQGSVTPSLEGLRGRVVVLEFWASWCTVCHLLAPTLNGWQDRYGAQGVTVLGVTGDPVSTAASAAHELGMTYALASDQSGSMLRTYRAFALPTVFVIDRHGKVRDVLVGYSTPRLRELEALVQALVAET